MNPIVFAIVVVVVLGLAGGVILVLASKFMAVYEDPRIAQVTECLAGANCGGCGYAGCADYAKAIVENGAPTFACPGRRQDCRRHQHHHGQCHRRPPQPARHRHLCGRRELRQAV